MGRYIHKEELDGRQMPNIRPMANNTEYLPVETQKGQCSE